MNELALFAGAGGGILGGHLLGWRTICAVEWEQYPASVLCARQNDGFLPPFPIWDDIQTFDGNPWRGHVDVISGGFPCQDISAAGRGAGINGERSGMWGEMARIIHEVRPKFVFVENSPMLTSRGLGRVLGDLATMGFDAKWGVLGAADVGAVHQRDRIWIVAKWSGYLSHAQYNRIRRWEQQQKSSKETSRNLVNSNSEFIKTWIECKILEQSDNERQTIRHSHGSDKENVANSSQIGSFSSQTKQKLDRNRFAKYGMDSKWWEREPTNVPRISERNMGGMVNGLASRVDRLKAIGNGQVPLCAAVAWTILSDKL